MRRALLLTVVLALTSTPAYAGWRIQRAETIADVIWHHPCNDQVRLVWQKLDGYNEFATEWTTPEDCTVYLDPGQAWPWMDFCRTILHAYGHLAGYRDTANLADPYHSLNPASVMYAGPFSEDDVRCQLRGRPFLSSLSPQAQQSLAATDAASSVAP